MPRFVKNSTGEIRFAHYGTGDYWNLFKSNSWSLDQSANKDKEIPHQGTPGGVIKSSIRAAYMIEPATGTQDSGVVVVSPDADWGNDAQIADIYGGAQAFLVLKEDPDGSSTLDDLVLFRVNGRGGMGLTGGIHCATGLRKRPTDPTPTYGLHVDPSTDSTGVIIEALVGGTQPILVTYNNVGEESVRIGADGNMKVQQGLEVFEDPNSSVIQRWYDQSSVEKATMDDLGGLLVYKGDASGELYLGKQFGSPSIRLGISDTNAVYIHKSAAKTMMLNPGSAGIIKINDGQLEMDEIAEPAAPAADTARLWIEDNGAGKSRLCAKFNTGAKIVLATQP